MGTSKGTRSGRVAAVVAAAGVAGAAVALWRRKASRPRPARRTGLSAGGMEYVALGDGPRTLLSIPGGPGSDPPSGAMGRFLEAQSRAYLKAGYTVWSVTRPRNMPVGHSVADMAADHARFIREQLGGRVDVVVGESYGGMIVQYLAADHPDVARHFVVGVAAATITDSGKDLDVRWARLRAEGRHAEAGAVFLEYVLPGTRFAGVRRTLGPLAGRMFAGSHIPAGDLLVEAEAEAAFDARGILSRIEVPVLLICGDADTFFSRDAVEETAALIPDCTLVWYPGLGHLRAASNRRLPRDVLDWVARREAAAPSERGRTPAPQGGGPDAP